jgi:excisionase family DNA binding protein
MAIQKRTIEESIRRMEPVAVPPEEQPGIEELYRMLDQMAHLKARRRAPRCELVGPKGEKILLPEPIFYVLERVAEVLARGDAVTVVPVDKELTTQQAADLLNVSRQYLVRLLDENKIKHTRTGRHRRVRVEDVLEFKERRDRERRLGLKKLTEMSEDAGGYPELE